MNVQAECDGQIVCVCILAILTSCTLDLSCLDKKEIEKKVNVQTEESTAIVLNVLPVLPESAEKPPLHSY